MTTVIGRGVELWVEERDGVAAVNPTIQALIDGLVADGADVRVVVPEWEVTGSGSRPREPTADLVLLKSATSLALSRAIAAERRGLRFLNGARVSWRAADKAATIARLAAAGLPVPPTYLTVPADSAGPSPLDQAGEWVSKPVIGVHGRGVSIYPSFPETLPTEPLPPAYVVDDGTRLVQRRVGGDEADVKVYVAGGRCFAARKGFHAESFRSSVVEPMTLPPAWTEVVLAAGDALDLRCFGVDLREHEGGVVVIDVNPFPGYRGFPEAAAALRGDVEAALRRDPT